MPDKKARYLHLPPNAPLPELALPPHFMAIVVIDDERDDIAQPWQWDACRWLVASGCACVLTWGRECAAWSESVEEANQEAFNYDEIPDDALVVATSHEDDDLDEAFWFARHRAAHPAHQLGAVVIVHVAQQEREQQMLAGYAQA